MKKSFERTGKLFFITVIVTLCLGNCGSNPTPYIIDGVGYTDPKDFKYTIEDNRTVTITGYKTNAAVISIPPVIEGLPVTSIGVLAFKWNNRLRSIIIPSSVTSIRFGAFEECIRLRSITIPSRVTIIGKSAFYGCSSLTSVTIPSSVTSIGEGVFAWCDSLVGITVETLNSAYSSVEGVLFNKNKTVLVAYPGGKQKDSYAIPTGVASIGERAFMCNKNLVSITIPSSVISIGEQAFLGCESLRNVTLSRKTRIGSNVFPSTAQIIYSD